MPHTVGVPVDIILIPSHSYPNDNTMSGYGSTTRILVAQAKPTEVRYVNTAHTEIITPTYEVAKHLRLDVISELPIGISWARCIC